MRPADAREQRPLSVWLTAHFAPKLTEVVPWQRVVVKIRAIKLPKSERFACAPHHIRQTFRSDRLDSVDFGSPDRYFTQRPWVSRFLRDGRPSYTPPVHLDGLVVAALTVRRARHAMLQHMPPYIWLRLFAVTSERYSDEAANDFVDKVLPEMRTWLQAQLAKPESMRVGLDEDLVVEWNGTAHVAHRLKYLVRKL
jgi:hypothetical protein